MVDLGVLSIELEVTVGSEMSADDRLARWRAGFEDMFALVVGRFAQADSRHRARMSLLGLLSGAERKNSWTIAEQAGIQAPDGMQRLLNFYRLAPAVTLMHSTPDPRRLISDSLE